MANSRSAYMAKKVAIVTGGGNVTFTPPYGVHTYQLRLILSGASEAATSVKVEMIDEDSDAIEVDGSPFKNTTGGFVDGAGVASASLEIIVDSANPALKVTLAAGGSRTLTVKCKAYRTTDDVSGGVYSTTLGVS